MTCRSEYSTYENRAPSLRLQYRLQLLSHRWENLRLYQIRRARFRKMRRKVRVYRRGVRALHKSLHGMIIAWKKDPSSVTSQDWAKAAEGKEKKVIAIYGKRRPRDKWPANVPYLNLIALYERDRKIAQEKKKKAARIARRRELKKKAEARALKTKKMEAEMEAKAQPEAEEAKAEKTAIPWGDQEAIAKLIQELEHQNKQIERQMELLRRSKCHPTFVEYDTWMNAVEGTDVLKRDVEIAGHVEMARRRKMGEPCDGWVRGRYFGPVERRRRDG